MIVRWWYEPKDRKWYFEVRQGNSNGYYCVNELGWK